MIKLVLFSTPTSKLNTFFLILVMNLSYGGRRVPLIYDYTSLGSLFFWGFVILHELQCIISISISFCFDCDDIEFVSIGMLSWDSGGKKRHRKLRGKHVTRNKGSQTEGYGWWHIFVGYRYTISYIHCGSDKSPGTHYSRAAKVPSRGPRHLPTT